jgi:flagellar biosynthesis protein FlhF
MRIKSYYALTMDEAMAEARRELGPEAMLVNSRRAAPGTRHLGEYEVIFATDLPATEADLYSTDSTSPAESASAHLAADLASLKKELDGMRRALAQSAFAPARWTGASATVSDALARLAAGEVSPELAGEIVKGAEARLGRTDETGTGAFQNALVEEMESRFHVEPILGRNEHPPRIVALVGPPGSGKTTTLVKLAVHYGLAARRPVILLTMDTYRIAAAEQLRSFAAILGVGFQMLETVGALAQSIEENRGKDLILIDTPGMGAGEAEHSQGLASFLSSRDDIDTHLVLSSSTKPADLTRMVDGFEFYRPQRLLFTKLDETGSFGPILNEAVRTGKPLSFFTNGQRIPEDLETASRPRLTELILSAPMVARSAA